MKKLFILTSMLALAACGGGSGGGGTGHAGGAVKQPVVIPGGTNAVVPRAAVSSAIAESNAEITNMSSEIVVASNSSIAPTVVRTPISRTVGGVTYTSYRLDDVKLFMAENLGDDLNRSYLSLELDENTGEIDAIKIKAGDKEGNRTVRSKADSRVFEGPVFEYVPDGNDEAVYRVVDTGLTANQLRDLETSEKLSGGHWNRVDERFDVKTYGKDVGNENKNLQYADFGHFNPVYRDKNTLLDSYTTDTSIEDKLAYNLNVIRTSGAASLNRGSYAGGTKDYDKHRNETEFDKALAKENFQLFAGGYALKRNGEQVDSLTPSNGMEFSGTAIGRVYSSIKANGADRGTYLDKYDVKYGTGEGDTPVEDAGHDIAKLYTTTNATLRIDNTGKQILDMPFQTDGFYHVTATKDGGTVSINFDSDTKPGSDTKVGEMYRIERDIETPTGGTKTVLVEEFNPGYYGVDTPVEAAGTVRYKEQTTFGDDSHKREWEFQGAYGMTKD